MSKKKFILLTIIMVSVLFVPNVFAGFHIGHGGLSSVGSGCVLGPKVTKDLIGVLNAFRIAAPLLMIGFTIFETIQSLTKGDGGAEMKKVFGRLKKRFVYVVLLIFVPTLVKLGLNAMGLTSECDLQEMNDLHNRLNAKESVCNKYGDISDFDAWKKLTSSEKPTNAANKSACEAAGCNYYAGWCTIGNVDTCNPNTGVYDGCNV